MTKVLFVLPDLRGGGAERVVLNVLRHLDSSRFAVTLFLIRRRGVLWNEVPENVRVVCASGDRTALYAMPVAALKLLWESRSQHIIVACLEFSPTYLTYLVGLAMRKPTVGWIHTSFGPYVDPHYLTLANRVLSRFVLKRLSRLVFVSEGAAQSMQKWLRTADNCKKNWRVIPNPFDVESYKVKGVPATHSLCDDAPSPTIVGIGRLEAAKGFDILVRAHAILLKDGVGHRVVIFGEGRDRSRLQELAANLGVARSVTMPGFVPNIMENLRGASAFVLCSRYEGFGMTMLEAMAAGVPVISTDCPTGPSEVLDGGKYGILVPSDDPRALAGALRRVLLDADLRASLAEAGARRVRDFAPGSVIPAWEQLLSELGG